jgi:hypothetical protein
MSVQIAAWCHYYWKETNPGAERFYRKISDRAFNQVLLHKISACTWDPKLKVATSPSAQTEMAAIAEFKKQDWVQQLAQDSITPSTARKHVDPNVAFPFQDDFSVGMIHGANAKAVTPNVKKVVEIQDDEDNVSVLRTKTAEENQYKVVVGSRVASGSNPVSGPTANSTPPGAASGGSEDLPSAGPEDRANGGPAGNLVANNLPSESARGETTKAQCGLSSGHGTSRHKRDQQHASKFRRNEAACRQHQLLSTCVKLKDLCINRKLRTTPHVNIMKQIRDRADRYRKKGRLQDEDLEEIIKEIMAGKDFKDDAEDRIGRMAAKDEHDKVMEAVEEGLLQVHGMAPNSKQDGIFWIMGENCNRLNNKIRGNEKIAKMLDIKDDLNVDCLMVCKHCLNFKHKDNKNNLKQMFQ